MASDGVRQGAVAAFFALAVLAGCTATGPVRPSHPELVTLVEDGDALALSDALEALIAAGLATLADRQYAWAMVRTQNADTPAAAFARAAITGRVVQEEGLRAAKLVGDVEKYARLSRALDPHFRDGAATRLLGTLYVIAPANLLDHGDSETGLELLEHLSAQYPDVPENRLRLAEAYITLNDPDPARPHLCFCLAHPTALRPDDQALLRGLIEEVGSLTCDPLAGRRGPSDERSPRAQGR
ncbi:MAG: tetratricopeptide repeat protein [Candidatus Rokuibacteriota bacterium]